MAWMRIYQAGWVCGLRWSFGVLIRISVKDLTGGVFRLWQGPSKGEAADGSSSGQLQMQLQRRQDLVANSVEKLQSAR
jgi:hypothetical protein